VSQRPTPADLHDFIAELKKDIFEETKRANGEKAFHRWMNPLCEGAPANPDGYACERSRCGDSAETLHAALRNFICKQKGGDEKKTKRGHS
jgi:hypothetical protein